MTDKILFKVDNDELTLQKVLQMQKRAVRIRTADMLTMFNELNWIPFLIETYMNRRPIHYKRLEGTTPD